ncbi:MAG: hypothetical protein A2Y34_08840 [Spirochaetes bacterium GWC1_27_15]|nr:MAG: hypothetical protein A2Y34_08840 [Spirochaetes bacterium GWC1_27_15]
MKILLGAKSCGFGPVSKMITIAKLLNENHSLSFLGIDTSLIYSESNRELFTNIYNINPKDCKNYHNIFKENDKVISVMDEEIGFWAIKYNKPLYFFDSLFFFWIISNDLTSLIDKAYKIKQMELLPAYELFHTLTVHERKVVIHILATKSFTQNYPGVQNRIELLKEYGLNNIILTGPIININKEEIDESQSIENEYFDILINLGGFKNFILDFDKNNYYLKLIEKWIIDFSYEFPQFKKILIAGGAYDKEKKEINNNSVNIKYRFLKHNIFVESLKKSKYIFSPAGLTTLIESVSLNKLPFLLSEQHYGSYINYESLNGTLLYDISFSLKNIFSDIVITNDDYKGSLEIINYTEKILKNKNLYKKFCDITFIKINNFINLNDNFIDKALTEINSLFTGLDLSEAVKIIYNEE